MSASAVIAAYLLALMIMTAYRNGTLNHEYFTDGLGVIINILLFSLTSRILSKRMHTLRIPRISPGLKLITVGISILIFLIYVSSHSIFINYFLNKPLSVSNTISALIAGAQREWLFSAPFVVVLLYMFTALRFVTIPQKGSDVLEDLGEIGDKISFAFIFICSCLISMLLRISFLVVSALFG